MVIEEMGILFPVYSFMSKNGTKFLWFVETQVLFFKRTNIMQKQGYVHFSQVIQKLWVKMNLIT